MVERIIDTNVAMVANRQSERVIESCAEKCIEFLIDTKNNHKVILDEAGAILSEYVQAIRRQRPYELGAQFLMHIFQSQYNVEVIRRVDLIKNSSNQYVDFPNEALPNFDRSDRKFGALSKVTGVQVTNATDSDWLIDRSDLETHGIFVEFLCGCDRGDWYVADGA